LPPPPSPPPLHPGGEYKPILIARFLIAADASSFDELAFKTALAAQFYGVTPSDIELAISAASIVVAAEVILPTIAEAEAGATYLTSTDVVALSAALGVSVGGVSDVAVQSLAFDAPSPPPPSPPPPWSPPPTPPTTPPLSGTLSAALSVGPEDDSQTWLVVLLTIIGVSVLLSAGYLTGRASTMKRRAYPNHRGRTVAAQSIGIAMTTAARPARCKVGVVNVSSTSSSSTAEVPMSPPPHPEEDFDVQKI